jgi:hypothetical protein
MQPGQKKRRLSKKWIALTVIIIADIALSACLLTINYSPSAAKTVNFYFGVEVAYGDFNDLKAVVTEVKNYTNTVVLGLPEVSINRTLLDQSCDYITSQDLNFIVLFTNTSQYSGWQNYTPAQWAADAKVKYGDKFVFWGGGVDTQRTLPFGTIEEVYKEVTERLEIFAPGGGFVFNTIHNIQAKTPVENILSMFKAIKDYNNRH